MFILKKGHQPGVYMPLRALFLVCICKGTRFSHDVAQMLSNHFSPFKIHFSICVKSVGRLSDFSPMFSALIISICKYTVVL